MCPVVLGTAADDDTELAEPGLQDLLQPVLRDQQAVGIAGTPRAGIQGDRQPGEVCTGRLPGHGPRGHRVEEAAHGQQLRRSRVDPAAAGLTARRRLPFQHGHRHPGQGQLVGQHQAGRAGTDDDHVAHAGRIVDRV
jgi:hypothetical protein